MGLLSFALAVFAACGPEYGSVSLSWQIVDRNGDRVYPGGLFDRGGVERDSCDLAGQTSAGETRYDLDVQLEICDPLCAAGCESDECLVKSPLAFSCETYRGADPDVPASSEPYIFNLRPVLVVDEPPSRCEAPSPSCVAVPGPRERILEPGLVVDLQVYQIAIDTDHQSGEPLDLEACGCA